MPLRKRSDACPAIGGSADDLSSGILLSVGCDRYPNIGDLSAAERDADRVFSLLTCGPAAFYDASQSRLLLSPSRSEFEECVRELLANHKQVETFTLYFAGHGVISGGSLYLCFSDTLFEAVSVSAVNVSQILRAVYELQPGHAHIILDACHSGGVALELGALLRSDLLNQAPNLGLSVLAASHLSESAFETPCGGGFFTARLLDALVGKVPISDTATFLGLGEIVRKLDFSGVISEQQPNFWDLNFLGSDAFCRNPIAPNEGATALPFGSMKASTPFSALSRDLLRRIWQAYLDMPRLDFDVLSDIFERLLQEKLNDRADASIGSAAFTLAGSFSAALIEHEDAFAPIVARVAMIRALFLQNRRGDVEEALSVQLDLIEDDVLSVIWETQRCMEEHPYHLVNGGAAELYFLPMRIAKLLGWIGFAMQRATNRSDSACLLRLRKVVGNILDTYATSIVAMCEDQAPSLLYFLAQCKRVGWTDEGALVVGCLYLDFVEHFGRVLVNQPDAAAVIDYLNIKAANHWDAHADFLQNPSDMLSVILLGGAIFDLDDAIDPSLIQLDRKSFSFFIPESYADFAGKRIESGETVIYQMGEGLALGHGIWSLGDMHRSWRHQIEPNVSLAKRNLGGTELLASAVLSLVMTDRVAWHLVPELVPRTAVPVLP